MTVNNTWQKWTEVSLGRSITHELWGSMVSFYTAINQQSCTSSKDSFFVLSLVDFDQVAIDGLAPLVQRLDNFIH